MRTLDSLFDWTMRKPKLARFLLGFLMIGGAAAVGFCIVTYALFYSLGLPMHAIPAAAAGCGVGAGVVNAFIICYEL